MSLMRELIYSLLVALLVFSNIPLANSAPVILNTADGLETSFDATEIKAAQITENASGKYAVQLDTKQLPEGMYHAFFTKQQFIDWQAYDSVSFDIANTGQQPVRFTFHLKISNLAFLSINDDKAILWRSDEPQFAELTYTNHTLFELGPGEKGRLTIPFSSLHGDVQNPPRYFPGSLNLLFNMKENEQIAVEFSEFILNTPRQTTAAMQINNERQIQGDSYLPIPVQGTDSIAFYQVPAAPQAKFSLQENYPGVTLTEAGKLTVASDAQIGQIHLVAQDEEGNFFTRRIKIIPPVYSGPLSIPPAEIVPRYDTSAFWFQDFSYILVRVLLVAVFALVGGIYFYGYKKRHNSSSLAGGEN